MDYGALVVGFVAGGCGSLVLWVTIGKRMMLKYAGQSVARAFADPDDDMKAALNGVMTYLWAWLNTPTIELVGPPDEEGNATKSVVTPLQSVLQAMIETIVRKMVGQLRGLQGAVKRDANQLFADLTGTPLPRKGQSTGEFLTEQLLQRIMPQLQAKAEEMLKRKGSDTPQHSGDNQGF